jgi:parallel beta-helix repeat protein
MAWSLDGTHDIQDEYGIRATSQQREAIVPAPAGMEVFDLDQNAKFIYTGYEWAQFVTTATAVQNTTTVLSSIFPQTGDKAGGYTITVYGDNIKPNSIVRIGGTTATVLVNNATSISFTAPAHSIGLNSIDVTDPLTNITRTLSNIFTYTEVVLPLPVISAISSGTPDTTEATITFTTDVNCSSYVQWGLTTTYDNSNFPGHAAVDQTSHSHTLTGLTPAVEYNYKITVTDINNNIVSSTNGTFTTATPATFPVNSAISSGTPTVSGATITWTTDIAASSMVDYGPTNAYGYSTTLDPTLVTSHSVVLDGLTSGTTYHYRVRSVSAVSAETVSTDQTFLTASSTTTTLNMLWDNTLDLSNTATYQGWGSYTLGTRFKASVDGTILGVRYWKYAGSVPVVVSLWNMAGTLLASRTASGETASGWQRMDFVTPISIVADTDYIVSYHSSAAPSNILYTRADNYFASTGRTSDKLYTYLYSEVTPGNGVFSTTAGSFPNQANALHQSFFADPVFEYTTGGGAAGPTITNINVSNISQTAATINWTLSEPGTGYYELGTVSGVFNITNSPGQNDLTYSSHAQNVSGLTAETTYYYRVRSTNAGAVETISPVNSFTTLAIVGGGSGDPVPGNYHAPAPTSSLVVNVRNTGATGNGTTDDTAAIQAAVNQVNGTGGTVLVPAGTYRINALTSIIVGSNVTLKLDTGAVLKAIGTSSGTYNVVVLNGTNINLVGPGTIQGERAEHIGGVEIYYAAYNPSVSGGEWGMGLKITASNCYVDGVTIKDCWGDGIYAVSGSNVNIFNTVCDHNRRQGLSIIGCNGMVIRDSVFKNTIGTAPSQGIDIEPNTGTTANNVQIYNCQMVNNHNWGFGIFARAGAVTNVKFSNNIVSGNSGGVGISYSNNNFVTNNTITDKYQGILFKNAIGNTATGNTISSPTPIAGTPTGNTVTNNTILPYP